VDQQNKERPKINPGMGSYLIYYKGSTAEQKLSSINGDGQLDSKLRKNMGPTS